MKIPDINKIDSHIQLFQTLTSLNILDLGDIVECQIEILQLFQLVQILHLLNDIILQIQDLQVAAQDIEVFYLDQFLLMQRHYLYKLNEDVLT